MSRQRLDAILSRYGYCSRSEARAWLRAGRVQVRDQRQSDPAQKAFPEEVSVDGEPLDHPSGILVLMHKPAGYVCSHDTREGKTVYELLPPRWSRRNPPVTTVGRLDKDTTGALLVTDSGELVQRLTSPRHKVSKVYEVTVDKDLRPELVDIFASGRLLLEGEDKPCLPARFEIVEPRHGRLELTEGRYHQVKRMLGSQGYEVLQLHRSRFGDWTLGELKPGEFLSLKFEV